ncbi:MAG: hypothetical protein Q8Q14_09030 [Gemmatimonadales bacterium]|nr:hypothetical protein [Gemmatimonadales bacterium]
MQHTITDDVQRPVNRSRRYRQSKRAPPPAPQVREAASATPALFGGMAKPEPVKGKEQLKRKPHKGH